ncbi:hypothetical protein [Streptomyces avicenniae]|uniref:hypothetical protein n=1 Tax=Streptomyces avicenniae TaxID=500153 RepID=UPI00069B60D9|nr:hypothetical protein [Streptomyces avicenniae]
MEDVFDGTGSPPRGWMHAVFEGGPYGEDVGRCVPGPPASELLSVPLPEGGVHTYRLKVVGSWSAPDDPIAVYAADGPPVPPTPLTDQERRWIQEGQRRSGLGPVGLIALDPRGRIVRDPDASAVEAMLADLARRTYVFLQRVTEGLEGDRYIHALLREDGSYEVEHRSGATAERRRAQVTSRAAVRDTLLDWAADGQRWRTALPWHGVGRTP